MKFTIASTADGCTLSAVDFQSSTIFPVPMGAGDLTALLSRLLADPDRAQIESGPVQIARTQLGVSIRTREGSFDLPWPHLFAIEGAAHV